MRCFVFVLAVVLVACVRVDDSTPVTIGPDPSPNPTPKTTPGPLPEQMALLGEPCEPGKEQPSPGVYVGCGRDGRIGYVSLNRRTALPEGAKPLEGSTGKVVVAIEGQRVWVQNDCPMCRMQVQMTMIADLDHATDAQLVEMQMGAELVNRSPLRDPEAWRGAISAWQPRR
jgi:hypothetical protein